ncbi:type IV secretory system conjugative DNA transfer family protein [Krasilnikovia sp. M28-CT-15]|uniref:type IV secretory system conjugative DNA transfer family protein n=1 Tax=Krasilnikovia sp. M28-CT-15 TaxID=3373540 RepID=UPI00387771CE
MDTTTTTRVRGTGAMSGSDYAVAALIGGLGFLGTGTWLSGQIGGLLFRWTWPDVPFDQCFTLAVALPKHWGNPREAWPAAAQAQLPGPVGFYTAAVLVCAVLITVTVLVWRWARPPGQPHGMASAQQLDRKLSARAVLKTATRIRPTLARKPELADVAVELGSTGRRKLYAGLESSVLLVAAPRQGKTSQVIIPWLRRFPGPAVVTSIRPDVLQATASLRGTAWLMELTGTVQWPHRVQWSPIAGCGNYDVARRRADVMIQVGKQETADSSNAGFFGLTATNLMAAWLHTAALCDKTMTDVLEWSSKPGDDTPVKLLRGASDANEGVLKMLDGFYRQPQTTRANLWATVQTGTASLLGPAAKAVFCGSVADSFDVDAFLTSKKDTVYLLVDEDQADALAPLVTAFVNEIITTAKNLAQTSANERLDPPLGLFLDEVTNVVPLPNLPQLMSYAAGSGIFVTAVLQNLAAAEHRWRQVGRKMIWSNATVKIALGGLAGDDLDEFSKLAGAFRETLLVPQRHRHGHHTQATVTDRKALSPDRIRTLDENKREALILHGTTPAVITRMVRHHESRDRAVYAQARTQARALMGLDQPPTAMDGPAVTVTAVAPTREKVR